VLYKFAYVYVCNVYTGIYLCELTGWNVEHRIWALPCLTDNKNY